MAPQWLLAIQRTRETYRTSGQESRRKQVSWVSNETDLARDWRSKISPGSEWKFMLSAETSRNWCPWPTEECTRLGKVCYMYDTSSFCFIPPVSLDHWMVPTMLKAGTTHTHVCGPTHQSSLETPSQKPSGVCLVNFLDILQSSQMDSRNYPSWCDQ